MKKVILLLSAVLFVVSCSKDNDDDIIKKETSKGKLEKIIKVSEDGTTVNTFVYGNNGFVKEIKTEETNKSKENESENRGYNATLKFHYNSKNYINKIEIYGSKKQNFNVNYDDKGRMVSIENENHTSTYKYDERGFMIGEKSKGIYKSENGTEKPYIYTTTYKYDSNGNVEMKDDDTSYIYDNKENPLKTIFPKNFKLTFRGGGVILGNGLSNNNVISRTSTYGSEPKTKTYTYTYTGNLPETVTYKDYNDEKVTETLFYKK